MKKVLLSFVLLLSIGMYNRLCAQVVFNEIYYSPGSGYKEYVELYNSSASIENLDSYSILSFFKTKTSSGFYVINLPDISLPSQQFSVGFASSPYSYQGGTYTKTTLDFDWSALPSSAYLKKYVLSSGSYVLDGVADQNDVLQQIATGSTSYITLLYKGSNLVSGLQVGGSSIAASLRAMPDFTIPSDGTNGPWTVNFSALLDSKMEYQGTGIGSDNGAHRTSDGLCGTWTKSSAAVHNTPGATNGPAPATSGAIEVGGSISCVLNANQMRTASWFVVASNTDASAYPLVLQAWADIGPVPGQLDIGDVIMRETQYDAPLTSNDVQTGELKNNNAGIIVVAKSTAGCFMTVLPVINSCATLPVNFSSFNAARKNQTSVALTWETSFEQNNKGFYVQRNTNGEWKNVAFVFTSADGGNSSQTLHYAYNDPNNLNSISYYRIQQVDIDGRARYSDVRAVRGEEQASKMMLFPNPGTGGKVNVMFNDEAAAKDVMVYDATGRVVKSFKSVSGNSLSINGLKPGMYSLQVTNVASATTSSEKFIIQN